MAENLLEKLDQRIQKNEKVTASEVADAYTQTIENRRKEYVSNGGSYEKFDVEEKAFLDGAKELRNKQLERIGVLGKEYEQKQQETINAAKEKERGVKFEASRKYARGLTDPAKSGAVIDDYEGTNDDDTYGFGRMSLSGYLAAMQSMNPDMAKRDWDKAVAAFKASNTSTGGVGGWFEETFAMDEHLSDENVKKIIGHENLSKLDGYDLAHESKAFVAGFLHYSDEYYKDANVSKAYKDYVLMKLKDLKDGGKLTYEYPKNKLYQGQQPTPAQMEWEKGTAQMDSFTSILNPKEWDEAWKERLMKVHEPFKKSCDTILAANPEFRFSDPKITEMLNKSTADLSYLDDEKLHAAAESAKQEISKYMETKKEAYGKEIAENKKKAEDLKTRNKALRSPGVSEEEWKNFDAGFAQQSTDLEAAAVSPTGTLQDLTGVWNKLVFVRDSNGLIKAKLEDMEKKTKDAEEKEPFTLKFLEEKNLIETYDAGGKQYKYELGESGFSLEGRKVVASSKNPEVKKAFENKTIPYIHALLDSKALTDEEKKQYDALIAKADPKDKEKWKASIMEASAFLMSCVEKKLTSDDLLKFRRIEKLYEQAAKESTFTFDHRPSLEELKKAYDEKFTPAWEKAGKDFDAEFKPITGPGVTPGPGPGVAPASVVGGGFLGNTGAETPSEKPSSSVDPYSDRWANGTSVPLDPAYKGFQGGLMVKSNIETVNFRDETTHKTALKVKGNTGASANEITFADPNADAWRVDDRTFVKVKYKGVIYYTPMEWLQKNDESIRAEEEAKKQKPTAGAETQNEGPLAFLKKINGEYIPALEVMLNVESTPNGVDFGVFYNKKIVPFHFTKAGPENYILQYPGGMVQYRSLRDAMMALNGGYVVQKMTYDAIRTPASYKPYEKLIDEFKKDIGVSPTGEVYFELDWKGSGRGEGNAQVWVTAGPYGAVNYRIRREHVGILGEQDRLGLAANFDDFMKQLGHIKDWSEKYEDRKDDKKLNQTVITKELQLSAITGPGNYYAKEDMIGRPVSFDTKDNGVVQIYLNWGGGSAVDINQNPMLNVWVNEDGSLSYILNFKGKGIVQGEKRVGNMDQMFTDLAALRQKADTVGGAEPAAPEKGNVPTAKPAPGVPKKKK